MTGSVLSPSAAPTRPARGKCIRIAAAALAVALAAGCQIGDRTGAQQPAGRTFAVGDNLLGEPCRAVPAKNAGTPVAGETAYDLFCGRWESPSGRIYEAPATKAPFDLAMAGWWRSRLQAMANCEAPVSAPALGSSAVALKCTLRRGEWPYQALVVGLENRVFLADMIPAAAPAAERAIAVLSGRAPAGEGDGKRTASAGGPEASALYSVGDLQAYRELLRLAQQDNYGGSFPQAEQRYRQALALQQKILPNNAGGQAFVLMHLALELSNQERFTEANALFDRSGALVASSLDPTDEPRWISYRAIHFANQRRYKRALELAQQATSLRLALAKQLRPDVIGRSAADGGSATLAALGVGEQDSSSNLVISGTVDAAAGDIVQSRFIEAAMLMKDGELAAAEKVARDAASILDAEPRVPRRWLSQLLLLQARIAEGRGEPGRAEQLLQAAIENERSLIANSRTEGSALVALGDVRGEEEKYAEALAAYRAGFEVFRLNGGSLRVDEAMPFFSAVIAAAQRLPNDRARLFDEAFAVAQLVRTPQTAQTMALANARVAAGDTASSQLIREMQDARRRRDLLNESLTRAQTDPTVLPPQLAAIEQEWTAVNQRIESLEREVQAAQPTYNQLIDAPASVDAVRAALRENEALVQILIGTQGGVGMLIDAQGIEVYPIALKASDVQQMVARLRRPFDVAIGAPFDLTLAAELYEKLFGPVRQRLAKAEHVIIVPSGPLLSLPPGVLVVDAGASPAGPARYEAVAWMARQNAITVSPSVQSFANLRQRARPSAAAEPFFGFGDFVPARDTEAISKSLGLSPGCSREIAQVALMQPLPKTASEVKAIAGAMGAAPGAVVLGPAFSEDTIKSANLADYRVLYFATHGLLPEHLDCWAEPSLVVSRPAGGDANNDGLLVASEIAELQLDADLVVLSACNTGGPGGASGGESLSGLARSFFYAGARSLLITHWQIPDAPTAELMVRTFETATRQNLPIAEALRQSQIAVMQQAAYAHPLNWAAFSVVGDGGRRLRTVAGRVSAADAAPQRPLDCDAGACGR